MSLFAEDEPRKPSGHQLGQDLSLLSVEEIDRRVEELKAEIGRLEAERVRKQASRSAADAFFRKPA